MLAAASGLCAQAELDTRALGGLCGLPLLARRERRRDELLATNDNEAKRAHAFRSRAGPPVLLRVCENEVHVLVKLKQLAHELPPVHEHDAHKFVHEVQVRWFGH